MKRRSNRYRTRLALVLSALILTSLSFSADSAPNPISAKLTVDEELALIRAFFAQRGKTSSTATEQDWIDAVVSIRGPLRPARTFWTGGIVPPSGNGTASSLTGAAGSNAAYLGPFVGSDRSSPNAPFQPILAGGVVIPTETGKTIEFRSGSISAGFPTNATNKGFTGISLDARVSYGTFDLPSGSRGFAYSPLNTSAPPVELPQPTGVTRSTAVGGSADGRIITGEGFEGFNRTLRLQYRMTTEGGLTFEGSIGANSFPGSVHTHPTAVSGDGSTTVGYHLNSQNRITAWLADDVRVRWTDLGTLPGQTTSEARAVTHNGATVVGNSGHGFIWTEMRGMRPLQVPSGATRSEARSISSDGAFIGGFSRDASPTQRAQLWLGDETNINAQAMFRGYGVNFGGATLNELTSIVRNQDGSYTFVGNATLNGAPRGFVAHLEAGDGTRPAIATQPTAQAAGAGGTAVFSVTTTNATGYQWQRNGATIFGATTSTLTLPNVQAAHAGNYTCIVANAAAAVASSPAALTVAPTVSRLSNLSVRATAGTGASTLIVGFTTAGGSKSILLRGVGPTLGQFGVPGALADPQLALFNASSVQTAQNDDWGGGAALTASFGSVGAFPLGATSKDAALLAPLAPGNYSAQLTGVGGSTGVALVESYDADAGSPLARFTNLSARNQVGTGANILIVGFNVTGNAPKRVLIRAVGPTLAQFGVAGTLADPQLLVTDNSGTVFARNDDWGGEEAISGAAGSVGAFPLPAPSRDAAAVVTLSPGSYTVQVSGVNNTTGVALAEIYELP